MLDNVRKKVAGKTERTVRNVVASVAPVRLRRLSKLTLRGKPSSVYERSGPGTADTTLTSTADDYGIVDDDGMVTGLSVSDSSHNLEGRKTGDSVPAEKSPAFVYPSIAASAYDPSHRFMLENADPADPLSTVDTTIEYPPEMANALKGGLNDYHHSSPTAPSPTTKARASSSNTTPWAIWIGNVPGNATEDELWRFFDRPIIDDPYASPSSANSAGVVSVFVINHTRCAFVNFDTEENMLRAVRAYDGARLRPHDAAHSTGMVCAIRERDHKAKAGVCRQRGAGLHTDWVQRRLGNDLQRKAARPGMRREESFSSANSAFLTHYFPARYFILKSATLDALHRSVLSGHWATQRHNEGVLDRAFRTSEDVYLFFSENKSGVFFGYAKMVGGIFKEGDGGAGEDGVEKEVEGAGRDDAASVRTAPPRFTRDDEEEDRDPGGDRREWGWVSCDVLVPDRSADSNPDDTEGDTLLPLEDDDSDVAAPSPASFEVRWLCTVPLPFSRTRHIHNPWNHGREVKIARDGTELEPAAGQRLMAAWKSWAMGHEHRKLN